MVKFEQASLNKNIPVPLYYQLKEHLRKYISNCADGDLIPPENEICAHFQVSRHPVRQAISELVSEGLLRREQGKGTFVTKGKVQRDFLLTFETFDYEILAAGRKPLTRIRSVRAKGADADVAAHLGIEPGGLIFELNRVRYTDDIPLMMVTGCLPADLVPDFDSDPEALKTLHKTLESRYNYRLHRATRRIEAALAQAGHSEILGVDIGSCLQYIETHVYLENGRCIEFSRAWYRGDQSSFFIELDRAHLDTSRAKEGR